jgi:hypothetical protein
MGFIGMQNKEKRKKNTENGKRIVKSMKLAQKST